ncbi:MAG: hypothetical protein A2427_00060 [Candidatus Nealsonbacteria bacterium RIFOXYC1_FULL_40_7]|uniref:Uncharacterized protein n=2 Tax=Candidatus Nealsoniibacteriota TaxID=1817911 RepID=A0A1G2EMD9_9BACT|nr:MAG: hypothetical protein A2427_00060 [Candidatus Nealsonbacteria bacterium RIFOXYC1_FULL_40_7]
MKGRCSMRKLFRYFPQGSEAYVILHSMWRASRGRQPSAVLKDVRNPRLALLKAQKEVPAAVLTFVESFPDDVVRSIRERLFPEGLDVVPQTTGNIPQNGFRNVHRLSSRDKYVGGAEVVMLVWNQNQLVPAECYRKANFGGKIVDIAVCEDPNIQKKQLGNRALIYHFP